MIDNRTEEEKKAFLRDARSKSFDVIEDMQMLSNRKGLKRSISFFLDEKNVKSLNLLLTMVEYMCCCFLSK